MQFSIRKPPLNTKGIGIDNEYATALGDGGRTVVEARLQGLQKIGMADKILELLSIILSHNMVEFKMKASMNCHTKSSVAK